MTNGTDPANGYGFTTADGSAHVEQNGLTKREHFAAMALQGLLSNAIMVEQYKPEYICELSVSTADALINALNQK